METSDHITTVRDLMLKFARQTGLAPVRPDPQRYLWTDAFALCNFLELHRRTGDHRFMELATALANQVHAILGRHRADDPRSGWISGLTEEEGGRHPTAGGLRIGKKLPERGPAEPVDEELEWDRDGQYFHYLTQWMHALAALTRASGDPDWNRMAMELAVTACARFVHVSPVDGRKRMYWKMSVDLSRPLVVAMGQHDPLDGLITLHELQMTAAACPAPGLPDLRPEIAVMEEVCNGLAWETDDPLGLGGLLTGAWRTAWMAAQGLFPHPDLPGRLLQAARVGLPLFIRSGTLGLPPHHRLAFRELGLGIGLHAVVGLQGLLKTSLKGPLPSLDEALNGILPYQPLAGEIEKFWLRPDAQAAATWQDHREINMVMLASSLLPEGYLRMD